MRQMSGAFAFAVLRGGSVVVAGIGPHDPIAPTVPDALLYGRTIVVGVVAVTVAVGMVAAIVGARRDAETGCRRPIRPARPTPTPPAGPAPTSGNAPTWTSDTPAGASDAGAGPS